MRAQVFKTFLWFTFCACFALGAASLKNTEVMGYKWAFPALCAFSVMYLLADVWKSLSQKAMFISVLMMGSLAYCAQFLPEIYYILTGGGLSFGYYKSWILLLAIPGSPIMLYMFKRYS